MNYIVHCCIGMYVVLYEIEIHKIADVVFFAIKSYRDLRHFDVRNSQCIGQGRKKNTRAILEFLRNVLRTNRVTPFDVSKKHRERGLGEFPHLDDMILFFYSFCGHTSSYGKWTIHKCGILFFQILHFFVEVIYSHFQFH